MQYLSENSTLGFELKKMTAKQALAMAKNISGKSVEEIAEVLGQEHSSVYRYFNESDQGYYPSLLRLPRLCLALENSLLLDWVHSRLDDDRPAKTISSENELLRVVNHLVVELGKVHVAVEDILDNPQKDHFDPKRLFSSLFELEHQTRNLRRCLQSSSEQGFHGDGWKVAVARG